MLGDQADIVSRIKMVLPTRWFPDNTPTLDALLNGLASAWGSIYSLLATVKAQLRLATASALWLDLTAADYFGSSVSRRQTESDISFRARLKRELLRERGTRRGLIAALQDLTGAVPVIFEPTRPADTGAWNLYGGYGAAGGWGNLGLPFQVFVTAYRPRGSGIAQVAGWGGPSGGYGAGALEYASLTMIQGQITDADINATIASVMPAATIAWTRITN